MKNKKLKRFLSDIGVIAAVAITVVALLNAAAASAVSAVSAVSANLTGGKCYSWYSVPGKKNHERPGFDVNLDDLKSHGAYAIGGDVQDKVIYLTFDFGYENGNVKKCLDALNKHGVKGAFFVLEHVVKTNPDLMKEIAATGHTAANHTMKHKNMCNISDFAQYQKELDDLGILFEETTGYALSKYYRPPKGEFTKQNLEYNHKLGYKTIFWSLAYMDWDDKKQPDPAASVKKILDRTHPGAVVLLHPTSATNAAIIETLIIEWQKMGYRFGTLDELTGQV
jgi:peptidoglycan-N-acetylmuramic acid deacetylase